FAGSVPGRNDCLRARRRVACSLQHVAGCRRSCLRLVDDLAGLLGVTRVRSVTTSGAAWTFATEASVIMATKIRGIEGLKHGELDWELQRRAQFVLFQYCLSVLVLTLRRPSDFY